MKGPCSFSGALVALKRGHRVCRDGWNGKGMFVFLEAACDLVVGDEDLLFNEFAGGVVPCRAFLAMKTAQNDVVPWVASQTDLLADDWYEIEE